MLYTQLDTSSLQTYYYQVRSFIECTASHSISKSCTQNWVCNDNVGTSISWLLQRSGWFNILVQLHVATIMKCVHSLICSGYYQFHLFWIFLNKTVILLVNSLPSDKPSLQNKNFVLSNPQYSLLKPPHYLQY